LKICDEVELSLLIVSSKVFFSAVFISKPLIAYLYDVFVSLKSLKLLEAEVVFKIILVATDFLSAKPKNSIDGIFLPE
tara:strand:- start:333 stop:566 length:234 start_codon:yes stop_codon:yes gene_type:complete